MVNVTVLKSKLPNILLLSKVLKNHLLDMSLLGQLTENALTRYIEIENPDDDVPNTFVDGRNHLFLSFAAVLAKRLGITDIITGICETDFSGYPDCRDTFVKSLNLTLNLAMDYNFVIQTPLMWLDKSETWELANKLGKYDYVREKTLTCYNGIKGSGCGECPSCKLRLVGNVHHANFVKQVLKNTWQEEVRLNVFGSKGN